MRINGLIAQGAAVGKAGQQGWEMAETKKLSG